MRKDASSALLHMPGYEGLPDLLLSPPMVLSASFASTKL
jgi:hypothetical protein